MYSQQPQQPQQQGGQYQVMDNYNNYSRPPPLPPHHQHHHFAVPPEPVPSATDAPPTPILNITQLADFASTMVYLMWHARRPSVMALHDHSKFNANTHTEDGNPTHSRETANIANRTSVAFKKFCKQILSATQLSESVILLSLKYIAMLLQNNPNIQGADGSEYRLFTVALMLANKFLDDNTFTNKTWSEVSGMKVTDLNIMELEFLDVLRFQLFIRKDEHDRWKSAVLLFRNQLLNADQVQKQEHQQQLLEETFKGIVLPNIQQTQQSQQQQEQYQFLLMLSKAQLPHYPTQPLNRPLTRVPLRIPLQPVWRNHQQQQQQQQQHQVVPQSTMYDVNNIPQQQQRPYAAAPTVTSTAMMNPVAAPPNDYYKQPAYDNYNNNNTAAAVDPSSSSMYHPQQQQQQQINYNTATNPVNTTTPSRPLVYSQPIVSSTPITSTSSSVINNRLSGINLSQPEYTNTNYAQTTPTQYYKLTPTTTSVSTSLSASSTPHVDNTYYNRNPYNTTPQQPQLRTRNSFYNEIPPSDYSSYDMSGSQPTTTTNEMYSRVPTAGYQQQQQHYRPSQPIQLQLQQQQQQQNNNTRKYNGPIPEDPLTAADSYRNHIN